MADRVPIVIEGNENEFWSVDLYPNDSNSFPTSVNSGDRFNQIDDYRAGDIIGVELTISKYRLKTKCFAICEVKTESYTDVFTKYLPMSISGLKPLITHSANIDPTENKKDGNIYYYPSKIEMDGFANPLVPILEHAVQVYNFAKMYKQVSEILLPYDYNASSTNEIHALAGVYYIFPGSSERPAPYYVNENDNPFQLFGKLNELGETYKMEMVGRGL